MLSQSFLACSTMLFFLLLLAFLTIVVGLGHAACASRFIRGAGAWRWVSTGWCSEGTGMVLASDLREVALIALHPDWDRCWAPTVGLAWRSHSGPPSSAAHRSAIYEPGTHGKNSLPRSDTGWSLTQLFTSGLRQTFRSKVAPTATSDVPRLWR